MVKLWELLAQWEGAIWRVSLMENDMSLMPNDKCDMSLMPFDMLLMEKGMHEMS